MDQESSHLANHLLGNRPDAALVEVTLGGFTLFFQVDSVVALSGADCRAALDGDPVPPWRTVRVRAGERLRLGYSQVGMRAYLAFPGGLEAERVFGSASTVLRESLGGGLGAPLAEGGGLRWLDPGRALPQRSVSPELVPAHLDRALGAGGRRKAPSPRPEPTKPTRRRDRTAGGDEPNLSKSDPRLALPLVTGYEWEQFSDSDRKLVLSEGWKVDPSSDRIAIQLRGPTLLSGPRVLDSMPLVDGTVQVTGAGHPLVFMRDRPTVGGYAKLGSVIPPALDVLAQLRPGTTVRFVPADRESARRRMAEREAFFGAAGRDTGSFRPGTG